MPKETPKKNYFKKGLILISGLGFLFSSGGLLIKMLNNPQPTSQPAVETQSVTDQLKIQEQGYLLVLEREPDNTTALQGLVQTRLELDDLEGTIAPLEKLTTIYPEDEKIKMLLDTVRQELANKGQKP